MPINTVDNGTKAQIYLSIGLRSSKLFYRLTLKILLVGKRYIVLINPKI
jgi:hypothetical protein